MGGCKTGARLQGLCTAYFAAILRHSCIIGHILRLERADSYSLTGKMTAETCYQQ
jgi:hypothetical protein